MNKKNKIKIKDTNYTKRVNKTFEPRAEKAEEQVEPIIVMPEKPIENEVQTATEVAHDLINEEVYAEVMPDTELLDEDKLNSDLITKTESLDEHSASDDEDKAMIYSVNVCDNCVENECISSRESDTQEIEIINEQSLEIINESADDKENTDNTPTYMSMLLKSRGLNILAVSALMLAVIVFLHHTEFKLITEYTYKLFELLKEDTLLFFILLVLMLTGIMLKRKSFGLFRSKSLCKFDTALASIFVTSVAYDIFLSTKSSTDIRPALISYIISLISFAAIQVRAYHYNKKDEEDF